MADEKITDAEFRKATDADPAAVFNALADAYVQDGIEIRDELVPHNPVTRKVIDAGRWATRQVQGSQAAAGKWLDGVNNPSRDPIAAGIEAEKKWVDKITQAIQQGRRVKGLQKSSLEQIKATANALGAGVYSSGVAARTAKISARVAELQPLAQSVSDTIQGMSNATDADRERRLLTARKLMIAVGTKRRG